EFLELIDESEVLLESTDLGDLVDHADTSLPDDLRELGALMRVAFQAADALRAREDELEVTEPEIERRSFDDTDTEQRLEPTVEELVSGDELPRRVRDAIYGGYTSAVCTIALLDPRPMPAWLRTELLHRATQAWDTLASRTTRASISSMSTKYRWPRSSESASSPRRRFAGSPRRSKRSTGRELHGPYRRVGESAGGG